MVNEDDLLRRLDRLESLEAIRRLSAAYAQYADSRDVDSLVELYVADCRVGGLTGRDALRESSRRLLGTSAPFRTTVHFAGQSTIDFDEKDRDRATGVVYCRAEHEFPEEWVVATLQYWDRYRRDDGVWRFEHRALKAFYVADVLQRPNGPDRVKRQLTSFGVLGRPEVPEAWPSWTKFWNDETV
jgi:hypothetical protein